MIVDNDLLSTQQARILAENAAAAQKKLASFSQEKLDAIVEGMAEAVEKQAQALAMVSHEETGYGKWQDKWVKNKFICKQVRNHLRGMQCVGVLSEDAKKNTIDIGVPIGVIVALCPVTSPVSTVVYKALIAIKSGNAILFSPHPKAMKSTSMVLDIMIEAAQARGLPEDCLAYLRTVTKSGTVELMQHPATSMIIITGVPGMVQAARGAGKSLIYGGTGNGPAFIERTADIEQAAQDIIKSKTFDNGIAPSAEQSVVVDACVAQAAKQALQRSGAYFMSEAESLKLAALLFCPNGQRKAAMVGLSAATLAQKAGFSIPASTKLLVAERKYVSEADPYSRELLSPVLAFYVEDDWMHACEKCIELLLHERNAHSLVIHSNDKDVVLQFALKKPVGRLLVNTPSSFGGMGATTNLFPSVILGSGSAGYGITSENVSPMNLIYIRRVGYGVRAPEEMGVNIPQEDMQTAPTEQSEAQTLQALQKILIEAIEVMGKSSGN